MVAGWGLVAGGWLVCVGVGCVWERKRRGVSQSGLQLVAPGAAEDGGGCKRRPKARRCAAPTSGGGRTGRRVACVLLGAGWLGEAGRRRGRRVCVCTCPKRRHGGHESPPARPKCASILGLGWVGSIDQLLRAGGACKDAIHADARTHEKHKQRITNKHKQNKHIHKNRELGGGGIRREDGRQRFNRRRRDARFGPQNGPTKSSRLDPASSRSRSAHAPNKPPTPPPSCFHRSID